MDFMLWKKKIGFKTGLSLFLALGGSIVIGTRILVPGTFRLSPASRGVTESMSVKITQSLENFGNQIKKLIRPDVSWPGIEPRVTLSPRPTRPSRGQPTIPLYPTLVPTGPARPTVSQPTVPRPTPTSLPGVTKAAFAQCLTQKGMKMYGVDSCNACQYQMSLFGSAFSYINYIRCDRQADLCASQRIGGYPTWEDGGDNFYPGAYPLDVLGQIAGCQAPS